MSSFERAEQGEIEAALARQAEPMHPAVPKVVNFVFEAIREYDFPFGIYYSEPPITPKVRHINRQRHGEGWHDSRPTAA